MRAHAGKIIAMSLLDELDKEAARRKLGEDEVERQKAETQRTFHDLLEPGLDRLRVFLDRLVQNLELLQRRITVHYPVPGYGDVIAHVEHSYKFEEVRHPSSRTLTVTFPCNIASNECALVEVQGGTRVRSLAGVFHRHRIGGMSAPQKNAAGDVVAANFQARGKIEMRATFHADSDNPKLRMTFENIEGLGTTLKSVPADTLDEGLFDEIGRYLMSEPNNLFREDLPEKYRRQLRQKVQHEKMRRHWETRVKEPLPEIPQDHPADGGDDLSSRLLSRVRDGVTDASAKLRGMVGDVASRLRKRND